VIEMAAGDTTVGSTRLSKAGMSCLAFSIHSHACAVKILSVSGNDLVPALLTKKILFEPYFGLG